MVVVVGVSGAGKTTLGVALAQRLGWAFQEGDDLQPPENIAKMAAGRPLTDADRAPWLEAVATWIDARKAAGEAAVVTCSALKRAYRDQLRLGRAQVRLVYLEGARDVIADRLKSRRHAYMPPTLLDSQLADLQPPGIDEGALTVPINQSVAEQVEEIVTWLA